MTFDAQSFLDSTVTGSNDTRVIPVPVGEYPAIIEKVAARQWQSKDGQQTGVALDIIWIIEDESVKQLLGRPTVTVKQGIMLDLTPSGGLDMSAGRNVGLGRLREALNKNDPSVPFAFSQLPGGYAKIQVGHRIVDSETYADVKSVSRIG